MLFKNNHTRQFRFKATTVSIFVFEIFISKFKNSSEYTSEQKQSFWISLVTLETRNLKLRDLFLGRTTIVTMATTVLSSFGEISQLSTFIFYRETNFFSWSFSRDLSRLLMNDYTFMWSKEPTKGLQSGSVESDLVGWWKLTSNF